MDTVRLFLLHMLDVIHLIVTVLSDHHSLSESVTLQLGRSGLSTCFCGVVVQRWHGAMLSGGLAEGRWAVLGMVTESF